MLRSQISGLDEFRDHLVGKRNAFAHLLSPRFLRPALGPCNRCAKGDRLRKAASAASYERRKPQARICRNAPGVPLVETAEGMRGWGHRHLGNESNTRCPAPQLRSGISVDGETLMKRSARERSRAAGNGATSSQPFAQGAPVLFRLAFHGRRRRVLDLDPVSRSAGGYDEPSRFDTMPSQPSLQAW